MLWPSHFASLSKSILVAALVGTILGSMAGCQTTANQQRAKLDTALQSAAERAVIMLQDANLSFAKAHKQQDVDGMLQAVAARNEVLADRSLAMRTNGAFREKTLELIEQIRPLVGENETEQAKIEKLLSAPKDRILNRALSSGGLYNSRSASTNAGLTREIKLSGKQVLRIPWRIDSKQAAIVYIEHKLEDKVELQLLDAERAPVCHEQNPRGFLICHWRAPAESLSSSSGQVSRAARVFTIVISNNRGKDATVLLIKNQ